MNAKRKAIELEKAKRTIAGIAKANRLIAIKFMVLFLVFVVLELAFLSFYPRIIVTFVPSSPEYWFQTGAYQNHINNESGASIVIENVNNTVSSQGDVSAWIGASLSNTAFLQVGYFTATQNGNYVSNTCDPLSKPVFLKTGTQTWFWEYFSSGLAGAANCSEIGPEGSVGHIGQFNTYGFNNVNGTWFFYLNNKTIGSTNLGNSTMTQIGITLEYAGATNNTVPLNIVEFTNPQAYVGETLVDTTFASTYSTYGVGSATILKNPYKAEVVNNTLYSGGVGD